VAKVVKSKGSVPYSDSLLEASGREVPGSIEWSVTDILIGTGGSRSIEWRVTDITPIFTLHV
jgi:hypothetical protein